MPVHTADEAGDLSVVRHAFDAWEKGSGTVFDLLTPDMTWRIEGSSPSAGTYDRAGLDALLAPFTANLAGPLEPRLRNLSVDGDTVVALFVPRHRSRTGAPTATAMPGFSRCAIGASWR